MIRALAVLLLSQAGCSLLYGVEHLGGTSTSDWFRVGPVAKPRAEVVATTRDVMVRQGYVVGPVAPAAARFESNWDVHLSSHWREGTRTKLEAEIEEAAGGIVVHVRSHTELNNNSKQPLSLEQAEWIGASLDAKWEERMNDPAARFKTMLKLRFFGLEQ